MAKPTDTPILTISTLVHAQPIEIDAHRYHIHHPDQLSIRDGLELEALSPKVGQLLRRIARLSPQEFRTLEAELDRFCRLVLDAPDAVHLRLKTRHRVAIVKSFIELQLLGVADGAPAARPRRPRVSKTGSTRSRGSSGSTVARSSTGSRAIPSAS